MHLIDVRAVSLVLVLAACGFETGGVGSSGASGLGDSSSSGASSVSAGTTATTATTDDSDSASTSAGTTSPSTSATTASSDTTGDPSGGTSGSAEDSTGAVSATDPSAGESSGAATSSSEGATTDPPPPDPYVPCSQDCPGDHQCVVLESNQVQIADMCLPPCLTDADCPDPGSGAATLDCPADFGFAFCVVTCPSGLDTDCPDGMECYNTSYGPQCYFPL